MSSLRNLPEQFAAGADISASRIEANLDALFAEINKLSPKSKIRRFVETHQVFGYSPPVAPVPDPLPWLNALMDSNQAATLEPPTAFLNQYRHKGCFNLSGDQLIWEISFSTSKPTILKNMTLSLHTNTEYPNDFKWGAAPPTGKVTGEYVDDLSFQLIVDSTLQTEDRKQTSVEAITTGIKLDRYIISVSAVNPLWDSMVPTHPQAPTNGLMIEVPALAYLPARARCRLQIIIPKYPMPGAPTTSSWLRYSWIQQMWSGQITLLEPEE